MPLGVLVIDQREQKMFERGVFVVALALLMGPDPVFVSRRAQIVMLAARHALPAIYSTRDFAEIGGLMSYGPNLADAYHQTGVYVGRVLASRCRVAIVDKCWFLSA
jgi:ABC-type uncharacterized transport system substrate-binding protein